MYEGRGRVRRVVWFAVAVVILAVATAVTFVAWPDSPGRPPAWSRPAPQPATPLLSAVAPGQAQPGASAVSADGLARALDGLLDDGRLGSGVGAVVAGVDGRVLYSRSESTALVPASALKIVTSAGVLAELGPDARFTTSTVRGASRDEVVLVGGGDPTLTRVAKRERTPGPDQSYSDPARLPQLARATADRLRSDGVRRVRLSVDDSRFAGPPTHPTWPSDYVSGGSVAPVTALSVDAGRVDPDDDTREPDPSIAAGELFADMLRSHGVDVVGDIERGAPPRQARVLAEVRSPRLEEIVETTLARSDNDMAETLLRQTAVAAGEPGSFDGGVRATDRALDRLGIDTGGLAMQDGSGLSRQNQVTAASLGDVLSHAASPRHPVLRPIVTGLPVGGFSGTLQFRFDGDGATQGAGLVRAKTGTLTGVSSLAGVVQYGARDADRGALVFAVLANDVSDPFAAEDQLDRVAAALAACGCG